MAGGQAILLAVDCINASLEENRSGRGCRLRSARLFLVLVVVGLNALDDDVIGAFFIDRPLAAVGVIA